MAHRWGLTSRMADHGHHSRRSLEEARDAVQRCVLNDRQSDLALVIISALVGVGFLVLGGLGGTLMPASSTSSTRAATAEEDAADALRATMPKSMWDRGIARAVKHHCFVSGNESGGSGAGLGRTHGKRLIWGDYSGSDLDVATASRQMPEVRRRQVRRAEKRMSRELPSRAKAACTMPQTAARLSAATSFICHVTSCSSEDRRSGFKLGHYPAGHSLDVQSCIRRDGETREDCPRR